jgi:hypothetical protein
MQKLKKKSLNGLLRKEQKSQKEDPGHLLEAIITRKVHLTVAM